METAGKKQENLIDLGLTSDIVTWPDPAIRSRSKKQNVFENLGEIQRNFHFDSNNAHDDGNVKFKVATAWIYSLANKIRCEKRTRAQRSTCGRQIKGTQVLSN